MECPCTWSLVRACDKKKFQLFLLWKNINMTNDFLGADFLTLSTFETQQNHR